MEIRTKKERRERIRLRQRKRIHGTGARPRLAVFRSVSHIYAQVIDDFTGHTVVAASSVEPALKSVFSGAVRGGIKGGVTAGESDQWGYKPLDRGNPTTCYDIHATMMHLLGIDHEKLTVRHNGLDRRLTDVHGHVIRDLLA